MILKGEQINTIIQNKYPLMILDTIEISNSSNQAKGIIILKNDDWFFKCHYPNYPIMPLSLLIESMTQVFSATFLSTLEDRSEIPVISSISDIKMKNSAFPGDTLKLVSSVDSFRRGIAKGNVKAYKNTNKVPICEFNIIEVLPSKLPKVRQ